MAMPSKSSCSDRAETMKSPRRDEANMSPASASSAITGRWLCPCPCPWLCPCPLACCCGLVANFCCSRSFCRRFCTDSVPSSAVPANGAGGAVGVVALPSVGFSRWLFRMLWPRSKAAPASSFWWWWTYVCMASSMKYMRKKPQHMRSSASGKVSSPMMPHSCSSSTTSWTSGKRWRKVVASRTPPPKYSRHLTTMADRAFVWFSVQR